MNTDALIKLWNVTQEHPGTSGARVAARVLLGLYNGARFKLDLTELRCLDSDNLNAAISVIWHDANHCTREVHEWLNRLTSRNDFGDRLEHLAHEYRIAGRCKRADLRPVTPDHLRITLHKAACA